MSLTRELIFEIYIRHKNHQRVIFLCEIFVQNGTTWNYVDCRSWNSNFQQNKNHSCDMVLGSTGWVPKKVKCQKSTSELGPGGSLKLPVTYVSYVWWCHHGVFHHFQRFYQSWNELMLAFARNGKFKVQVWGKISNQCLPLVHTRSKCMSSDVLQIFHSPPCQYIYSGPIQGWCNALLGDKDDEKET